MQAAGIDPKNIDTILVSHFHGDHISGIRAKAGAANFPNAEIMVPARRVEVLERRQQQAKVIDPLKAGFANVKRVFDPIAKDVKQYEHGQGTGARYHGGRCARPQPGPHGVPRLRQATASCW